MTHKVLNSRNNIKETVGGDVNQALGATAHNSTTLHECLLGAQQVKLQLEIIENEGK